MRLLISYPKERRQVIDAWVELIKQQDNFDLIAATATSAIPQGAWISDKMDLPMVYVRDKAKSHGKKNRIEGVAQKGQKTVVVEDLISTASSALDTQRVLTEQGIVAEHIVAIYSYTLPQSKKNLEKAGVKLATLTTFPVLARVAIQKGVMTKKESKIALDWLQDSAGWAKRHGLE
jgi:orotate phosphoribosyltransferase